jgi:hypothetical protein
LAATGAWRNSQEALRQFIDLSQREIDLRRNIVRRDPLSSEWANELEKMGITVPRVSETNVSWWFYEVAVDNWREVLRATDVVAIHLSRTLMPYLQDAFPTLERRKMHVLNPFLGIESIQVVH